MSMGRLNLAGILLIGSLSAAPGRSQDIRIGDGAPEVDAHNWLNANGPVSLEALRGKIVVVEFWATWCPPCRQSIPHLNKLQEKWKKKGVVVVSLTREALHEVKDFARAMKMQYIIGTGSSTEDRYGVQGIPTAVVVNPKGQIAWAGHPMGGLDRAIQKIYDETPPQLLSEKKLAKLKKELAEAQRAFKRGVMGRAYRLTGNIIEASPEEHEIHASARALMDELAAIAETRFEKAAKHVEDKQYAEAVSLLSSVLSDFAGSEDAAKARKTLIKLKGSPEARAALRKAEQEERAKKRFERAEADLNKELYATAHRKFSEIVKKYANTEHGKLAKKKIDQMMADEAVAKAVRQGQAKKMCVSWLSMARSYAKADNKAKAKDYYNRILEKYPDTSYAKTAREELGRL